MSSLAFEKSNPQGLEYQIVVNGKLDSSWSEWFGGLRLTTEVNRHGNSTTRLTGMLPDQCALRGILNKLWDLNIILLSVECIDHPIWR